MDFKPFDVVIYANGSISKHRINNKVSLGTTVTVSYIGKKEKSVINKAYEKWKKKN